MKLPFSQRHKARAAAVEAVERYPRECVLPDGSVREFWGFVVDAAIAAIDDLSTDAVASAIANGRLAALTEWALSKQAEDKTITPRDVLRVIETLHSLEPPR